MKKALTSIICLILSGLMLLSCTSCESVITISANAAELSEGYERKATDEGEVTDDFINAFAKFSMDLFRGLITKDSENDLISPLSAVLCLAMIANGADGDTKTQMEKAFGMSVDELNRSLYAFTSSLYTSDDCKLSIADSIWVKNNDGKLHVNEDFLQTNADWYNSQIYSAPFDDETLQDINSWCKKYTDGMIEKMIDEIDPDTVMYLINALVFDAKWADEYEEDDISDLDFTSYDGTKKTVEMLGSTENTYLSATGVTGFAKKYAGGKYSIVALLPDEGTDIYDYIASLTGENWMKLWNNRESEAVAVKMPEFSYSANLDLNETLSALGMTNLFDQNKADLSELGTYDGGNLYVSKVCQKTFIDVSRNGTKAAAVTWGAVNKVTAVNPTSMHYVILDRPFVYAIVDNATGLPLFIGAVTSLK